jgi:DHA3 family multidrug efflux protein-like MFS transporter
MKKTWYAVIVNSLAASLTNTVVWFAVTFWVYLQTHSVVATSVMAGVYLATVALSGVFLGSLVDRYPKKRMLLLSSSASLVCYVCASSIYSATPPHAFTDAASMRLWAVIVLALVGAIAGNLRGIALATLVTILVPEAERDRANGLVGTANGVAFLVASIVSGLAVGFFGIAWVLVCALALTVLVIGHLWTIAIPQPAQLHADAQTDRIDLRGTIGVIRLVPGLFGLIFFHTFNNFLGGVFMSLMDAYGLLLVSVQVWGVLWGVLSLGFIVGGLVVAKQGLGKTPLRTLFLVNIAMWTICIFFTIQSSIILLTVGLFLYLCLIPVAEASEQTILQSVIPLERQGRVFGFAQSIEQAASPVTAFVIGPIAQFIFIPFMTTGGAWISSGVGSAPARIAALPWSSSSRG